MVYSRGCHQSASAFVSGHGPGAAGDRLGRPGSAYGLGPARARHGPRMGPHSVLPCGSIVHSHRAPTPDSIHGPGAAGDRLGRPGSGHGLGPAGARHGPGMGPGSGLLGGPRAATNPHQAWCPGMDPGPPAIGSVGPGPLMGWVRPGPGMGPAWGPTPSCLAGPSYTAIVLLRLTRSMDPGPPAIGSVGPGPAMGWVRPGPGMVLAWALGLGSWGPPGLPPIRIRLRVRAWTPGRRR